MWRARGKWEQAVQLGHFWSCTTFLDEPGESADEVMHISKPLVILRKLGHVDDIAVLDDCVPPRLATQDVLVPSMVS